MNRRDFIIKTLKMSGMLLTGNSIEFLANSLLNLESKNIAHAADYTLYASDLPIVENYFSFTSLAARSVTNQIIVHHSATSGDDISAADIHRMHLQNGWSGIGYHMFIRKSGLIETGRPLEDMGAHTYQHNRNSIGICLSGNFNDEMPTDMQITSASKLIGLLCQMYSLSPDEYTIFGHRDFNATACPGENLYANLPYLRELAGNLM